MDKNLPPVQGAWVPSLVGELSSHRATKSKHCNYRAAPREGHTPQGTARELQLRPSTAKKILLKINIRISSSYPNPYLGLREAPTTVKLKNSNSQAVNAVQEPGPV